MSLKLSLKLSVIADDWRGDNAGPPLTTEEVKKTWQIVQGWFPGAEVVASDLEAFTTAALATPAAIAALPVVTKEIGARLSLLQLYSEHNSGLDEAP